MTAPTTGSSPRRCRTVRRSAPASLCRDPGRPEIACLPPRARCRERAGRQPPLPAAGPAQRPAHPITALNKQQEKKSEANDR